MTFTTTEEKEQVNNQTCLGSRVLIQGMMQEGEKIKEKHVDGSITVWSIILGQRWWTQVQIPDLESSLCHLYAV